MAGAAGADGTDGDPGSDGAAGGDGEDAAAVADAPGEDNTATALGGIGGAGGAGGDGVPAGADAGDGGDGGAGRRRDRACDRSGSFLRHGERDRGWQRHCRRRRQRDRRRESTGYVRRLLALAGEALAEATLETDQISSAMATATAGEVRRLHRLVRART